MKRKRYDYKNDMIKFPNYFAVMMIVPAVLSVMAYEFVDCSIHILFQRSTPYRPLDALGILIPMALMTELFTFFWAKVLYRKLGMLIHGLKEVASGNYDITLNAKKAGPFHDAVCHFNRMTGELRSVETLRNDFINDFSHEFKTPITSINGFAELLLETDVSEEERRQYLQIIAEESKRLSTLAKETMMMSKLEHQTIISDKKNYALDEQIKQAVILLSPDWNKKELDLDVQLSPAAYCGNADLMSHIWINLLSNAIKFTPPGGHISVSLVQTSDNEIQVKVADSGKGMSKEECARIFTKYYQGDCSHSEKGLGLGLSIAQRIVTLCGGSISVTSSPGNGSCFTVTLP